MAIKKVVKVKVKFETSDNKEKAFHLKIQNFDKKKQKQLKAYGKELEEEFKGLNSKSRRLAKTERKFTETTEDFVDAQNLAEANPKSEGYALALVKARKKLRKARDRYEALKVKEIQEDSSDMEDLNEKIFKKQLELIVLDADDFLNYVEKEGYSFVVVVSEIFKLVQEAQKNA